MIILGRIKEITDKFIKTQLYGKSDVRSATQVLPSGVSSKPIKEKIGLYLETEDENKSVCIGTIHIPSSSVKDGEIKIYAVNDDGEEQSFLQCHNTDQGSADNWAVKYTELKDEFEKFKDWAEDHVHDGVIVSVSGGSGAPAAGTVGDSAPPTSSSGADITKAQNKRITISNT